MNPALPNWYYVYLLRSEKDDPIYPHPSRMGGIYIGCTSNLQKRMKIHKEGKNYTTKKMLPVELVYFEAYRSRKDAFMREKRLKYYSGALRNLKIRLQGTLRKKGGAG